MNYLIFFPCKRKTNSLTSMEICYPNGQIIKPVYIKEALFCGGSNIKFTVITCENKIIIILILQSYVFIWYHRYLLHIVMDRMEAIFCQQLYWPGIREYVYT